MKTEQLDTEKKFRLYRFPSYQIKLYCISSVGTMKSFRLNSIIDRFHCHRFHCTQLETKLVYTIKIYHNSTFSIENGVCRIYNSFTRGVQNNSYTLWCMSGNCFKHVHMTSYYFKHNGIHICYWNAQKHVLTRNYFHTIIRVRTKTHKKSDIFQFIGM